ncbi:MAG TPA: hypothetical protein PL124_01920 [Candidatus Cloacimonadota bacterium]|nr:hypothetical protein [Candidatus Cloacimonadota bacterium]HPS38150.1 hypothetical protein [Candidatus Cloacimonadota bacterium]
MKRTIFIIALLVLLSQVFATQVTLKNGKIYSGKMVSSEGGIVILMDDKVTISIPKDQIQTMMEEPTTTSTLSSQKTVVPAIDAQYIQSDDYFMADEAINDDQTYIWVEIGKLRTAATPETKNQAKFFNVRSGREEWKSWWAKTQIATQSNLVPGTLVIAFNDNNNNDVYEAPESTEEARTGGWFLARITDVSDFFKGYIIVSGGYKVGVNNLRIAIRG